MIFYNIFKSVTQFIKMVRKSKRIIESDLYPTVKKYLDKKYSKSSLCSKINIGIKSGTIDVVLVRGIFGDLSQSCEVISVEVKADKNRFLNYIGQALGYSILSDRCHLAIPGKFSQNDIDIASTLGIGLIEIGENSCKQIIDSKLFSPIEHLRLKLLNKLKINRCTICNSYFFASKNPNRRLFDAIKNERGYVYWLIDQDQTACEKGIDNREYAYRRRFICKDCIQQLIAKFEINKK